MPRRLIPLLLMLAAIPTVHGQMVELVKGHLYFNTDRVWSYNLYEQSRWGGGLRWTGTPGGVLRLTADAYAGYGYLDRRLKGGLGLEAALLKNPQHLTFHASAAYDLTPAGSRRLTSASLTDLSSLSSFMSRRMTLCTIGIAGAQWRFDHVTHRTELRLAIGSRMFDSRHLLYPANGDVVEPYRTLTFRWVANHPSGLSAELLGGRVVEHGEATTLVRLVGQYDHTFGLGPLDLVLFGQGGLTPMALPYTYMFDLGGTQGAPLCFDRTLLTALPCEFAADRFAFASILLRTHKPLVNWFNQTFMIGTAPRPFVRIDAAVGSANGQDAAGRTMRSGIDVQAPTLGIAEGVAGVEGAIRYGVVDWGIAVAYRVTPSAAAYHRPEPVDNLLLLLTATLHTR